VRYIFITGGVVSSLGKGIAAASLGVLLQSRGYSVRLRKLDPYLNVDPGTMSPYQHGEVYVTDDGGEADLDLGHYERFTGVAAHKSDNWTSGRILSEVIASERRGDYLGATVQVIPHVTDFIKSAIQADVGGVDFVIVEVGGTAGDIESLPFLEAIRQLGNELGRSGAVFIHVTLVPYISAAGELKTKPTQRSVRELLGAGIQPQILLCRADRHIPESDIKKIALYCNVLPESVITALNARNIYEVPSMYHESGLDKEVLRHFGLSTYGLPDLNEWRNLTASIAAPKGQITIAVVGKYTSHLDSYKSLIEALSHGGLANNTRVDIDWIDAEILEKMPEDEIYDRLRAVGGILVPGGFGERGTAGKIAAIKYARERLVPFLGICFGMQLAVIEFCRNKLGLVRAGSTEFGHCEEPVVGLMTEWAKNGDLEKRSNDGDVGGTMRLGGYPAILSPTSLISKIYGGRNEIMERHRHRYEVNINYRAVIESAGFVVSGVSPDGRLPEVVELVDHPWFVGVQFHPEFKSRPFLPHPIFVAFIQSAIK
jgi:CTP synthase